MYFMILICEDCSDNTSYKECCVFLKQVRQMTFNWKGLLVRYDEIVEGEEYSFRTTELTWPVRVKATGKHRDPTQVPIGELIDVEILQDEMPFWKAGTTLSVSPQFLTR